VFIFHTARQRDLGEGYAIIAAVMTKRQLGFILVAIGGLIIVGVLAVNVIGAREAGFGPFQKIGLALGVAISVMAIPLIRLGNKPA
jgi:hypothetical protein